MQFGTDSIGDIQVYFSYVLIAPIIDEYGVVIQELASSDSSNKCAVASSPPPFVAISSALVFLELEASSLGNTTKKRITSKAAMKPQKYFQVLDALAYIRPLYKPIISYPHHISRRSGHSEEILT